MPSPHRDRVRRMLTWFLMGGVSVALALPQGYPAAPPRAELAALEGAIQDSTVRLSQLESRPGWAHLPHAILPAALDAGSRGLALRLGDWLAREEREGAFRNRLDWHRDTYMWLEAYRLLRGRLSAGQRAAWAAALRSQVAALAAELERSRDAARYTGLYLHTSPNHYALYAATVHLGGLVLGEPAWRAAGAAVMRRFIARQHPDGFWGELREDAPTLGYNALTLTAVGLYYEHTGEAAARVALERATRLHAAFTDPDGHPNELMNDRNRHWFVSPWGHFAFSHFPAGRRLGRQLARQAAGDRTFETLGRLAQNTLYWHDGPEAAPEPWSGRLPVWRERQGPWTVTLSALTGAAPAHSPWFLDRQSHVSVHHERLGLIVSGAPSKGQPQLAQFAGTVALDGARQGPAVTLAYPGFTAALRAKAGEAVRLEIGLAPHGPRPPVAVRTVLQVVLHAGEAIETASGHRAIVGRERLEWPETGGEIRHHGWTLRVPPGSGLTWPVYGYSPYRGGPEERLEHAVATVAWEEPVRAAGARPSEVRITAP